MLHLGGIAFPLLATACLYKIEIVFINYKHGILDFIVENTIYFAPLGVVR